MEFIPICVECDNFYWKDKCPYYNPIPHDIKNREAKCTYFSDGEYELFSAEAYPRKENKIE